MSAIHELISTYFAGDWQAWTSAIISSFLLISAAEIGDKSQLVCMALAARHRAMPVIFGAISAFALLNAVAVLFGAAIASWLPDVVVLGAVIILFAIFGIHALRMGADDDEEITERLTSHGLFLTAFTLITLSEFGDKTQLAVVALSSTYIPFAVWLGATLALAFTSVLGVLAGATVLKKIPMGLLHKISGIFFLLLALFAGYQLIKVI